MVIKLNKAASKRFLEILNQPLTKRQKEVLERSKGTYAYYKDKWTRA